MLITGNAENSVPHTRGLRGTGLVTADDFRDLTFADGVRLWDTPLRGPLTRTRLGLVVIASEAKQSRGRRLCDDEIAAAPDGASQ